MNVKYPDLKSDLHSLIAIVDLSEGLGSYSLTQNIKTSLTAKGELNLANKFTQLVYLTDGQLSNCDGDDHFPTIFIM